MSFQWLDVTEEAECLWEISQDPLTHTKMCAPTHPLLACYRLSRSRPFTPSMKRTRTCPSPRNRRWRGASAKLCARDPVQPSVAFYSHGAPTVRGRNSLAAATKQRGIPRPTLTNQRCERFPPQAAHVAFPQDPGTFTTRGLDPAI